MTCNVKTVSTICMVALGLSACSPVSQTNDDGCAWIKPIFIDDKDALTDPTARAILAHNEMWAMRCRGK